MIFKLDHRYRLMLVLLAFAAYAPTLKLGFLWDDHIMIEANPHLRVWSAVELRHDFTTDVFDGHGDLYYRPAQTLLNRVDFTLWKLHPLGYHLTNFIGHVANGFMTIELGLLLGLTPLGAFIAGTLLVVHPIVVEQLMIIAGRAEIFGLLMTLLALYFLLQNGRKKLISGYAFFILALLFKESAVVTPALLALCLWINHQPRKIVWRIFPCLLLLFPYFWLRRQAVGNITFAHDPRLITQFWLMAFPHVFWTYLRLLILPWNLHSHHMMPRLSHFWLLYLAGLIGLLGFLWRRRARWGIFALGWFLICLIPKTPVMIFGNFMLEHWGYPAYVGLFFLAGRFFAQAWNHPRDRLAKIAIPAYLGLLIFWALLVHLNVALRGTDETMYRWALRFTTSNPIRYNLGVELLNTGRPAEAASYFEAVRSNYPDDVANLHALALAYWQSGHRKAAYYILKQVCQTYPQYQPAALSLQQMKKELVKN